MDKPAMRSFKSLRDLLLLVWTLVAMTCFAAPAQDSWPAVLNRMPLGQGVSRLDRTNCVAVMLKAFQPDPHVKALIFMPGATDELYMFHRVNAVVTNGSPTLLDAVTAL